MSDLLLANLASHGAGRREAERERPRIRASVADGMPVRLGMRVCVGRREPARAWLPHADTGRVDGVTALRCNRQRHRHLPRPDG